MAQAAKIIKIDIRVGGGGGSSGEKKPKDERTPRQKRIDRKVKQKLSIAGGITTATQLISKGIGIMETLSYNSAEKENLMYLSIAKSAVSSALVGGGALIGGPIGAAVGLAINKAIVEPASRFGEIGIQRHLDQTRATNRFYLTNFATKGNFVYNYASGVYVGEDLQKIRESSMHKRRYR